MPKTPNVEPSNDIVREIILKYLYDSWNVARGMESHKLMVSQIYSELKKQNIERKYVVRNLTYLIETKWVIEEIKEVIINLGKTKRTNEKKTYYISKDGIDFFDGNSKFQKTNRLVGINVNNLGNGIVVLGDNNIVRNEHKDLSEFLDKLGNQMRINSKLSDNEKIDYQGDIDTIKDQLKKSNSDKGIIKKSWNNLNKISTLAGIVGLYDKVKPLIDMLLGKLS
jgi:hypothetical protein